MKLSNIEHINCFQISSGLHIFSIADQINLPHWEPLYVGSHADPYYDERHTWEGQRDKITQAYILCLLEYEFYILDNAFLVHRPGIKKSNNYSNYRARKKTNLVTVPEIQDELESLFGKRDGCSI